MRQFSFFMFVAFFLMTLFLPDLGHAACLSSAREIDLGSGSMRMKAYSCALSDGRAPALQVEFDRLSEAAAGGLLEGAPDEELRKMYGAAKVLHNKVFVEAKSLFDNYGIRMLGEECSSYNLVSAETGANVAKAPDAAESCGKMRVMWYLTFPDRENLTTKNYPPSWKPTIVNHQWPAGWRFFYADLAGTGQTLDGGALLSSTSLWRPIKGADLARYKQDIALSEAKIGAPLTTDNDMGENQGPKAERYFLLVDHLTRGNFPDDFLTLVVADPASCGCGADGDGIHIRQLVLHTAFVKNVSNASLAIDGLSQGEDESEVLRLYSDGQAPKTFQTTPIAPVMLAPGETLAIPLRMKFVPSDSLQDVFSPSKAAAAQRIYGQIQTFPSAMLQSSDGCEHKLAIRRDSFGPPTQPSPRPYSFGPAVTLKGVSVSGNMVDFDNPLSNFLQLVAGSGYGSCPYVYAYNDSVRDWVRHGKIIDNASSPAKETTQRLEIPGLTTRFRISEEELELTYVRKVRLELSFEDGRTVILSPMNAREHDGADPYDRIKYGESHEYLFSAPADEASRVLKSTLVVTGYYMRYADLTAIADETRGQ
jgi:hypothetical protein